MTTASPRPSGTPGINPVNFGLLLSMVLLAPVFRGGNRSAILFVLEVLALLLLAGMALQQLRSHQALRTPGNRVSRVAFWLLVSAPAVGALVQLIVMPLTGHPLPTPTATEQSYLASLPLLCCLLFATCASDTQALLLARLWAILGVAEAIVGLTQLGTGALLRFGAYADAPIFGTFASKNTYSNFLVMTLPLALSFATIREHKDKQGSKSGFDTRWLWGMGAFALLTAVFISTSRTGIVTALLVCFLSCLLLIPTFPKRYKASYWLLLAAGVLVILSLASGGFEWLARFDGDRLEEDIAFRSELRSATIKSVLAHLPFGSGSGSFAWISSNFQPAGSGQYWLDLAHSDYLQLFSDTGLLGVVWVIASMLLFVERLVAHLSGLVKRTGSSRYGQSATQITFLPLACSVGLFAFGLHAWVDYPFHIPANAMMAATLLGLMCRHQSAETHAEHPR